MTKAEIVAEILAMPMVFKQLSISVVRTLADGTKMYQIELLEVLEKSAKQRAVAFYVLNEGLPNEMAYYRDVESVPQIQTFMDKLKPLLKEYNAKIIESGETWALCETNILVENVGIWSIIKDRYFVVDGTELTITKIG